MAWALSAALWTTAPLGCESAASDPALDVHVDDSGTSAGLDAPPSAANDVHDHDSPGADAEPSADLEAAPDEWVAPGPDVSQGNFELPPCLAPSFPQLDRYPPGSVVSFSAAEGTEVAWTEVGQPAPDTWVAGPELQLPSTPGAITLYARTLGCDPATATSSATIELAGAFAANGEGLIALDDRAITGWAAQVEAVLYGTNVDATWRAPEQALGPAGQDPLDVLVLGNGGVVTLVFDPPIRDVVGPDLAVFENGNGQFLELAFVEVSSDGTHFERFANRYLGTKPVPGYGVHASELIGGLAGKYSLGSGTPFDLASLSSAVQAQVGLVDLDAIRYVRIVDIVGDGNAKDSFGGPIYDPTPTIGSGGFDLDGVCTLGQ